MSHRAYVAEYMACAIEMEFSGADQAFGSFRLHNADAFNNFLDGRFFSNFWYSPNDIGGTTPTGFRSHTFNNVYGTTLKALIHEEFGDGIMSAIDFSMDITREPDPKGDRVHIVMSGKFLPYKTY